MVYLVLNVAYLSVLPAFGAAGGNSIVATPAIAVSAAESAARGLGVFSVVTPIAVSVLVSVSATGSTNVAIMTAGRSIYAMARAGEAPGLFATLSRWDTPFAALWAQSIPAISLILLPGAGLGVLTTFRECAPLLHRSSSAARHSQSACHLQRLLTAHVYVCTLVAIIDSNIFAMLRCMGGW
eukprot:COSAG02_NODE_1189_length_13995_cov_7.850101_1_plen_182_part_00